MSKKILLNNKEFNEDPSLKLSIKHMISLNRTTKLFKLVTGETFIVAQLANGEWEINVNGKKVVAKELKNLKKSGKGTSFHGAEVTSPMPGKIIKILVKNGQEVEAQTPLLVLEAMKMEHTLKSPKKGTIVQINCTEGQLVQGGIKLVQFADEKANS